MCPPEVASQIMVVGITGAGKSSIAHKPILHKKTMFPEEEPTRIIYCYNLWQKIYEDIISTFPIVVFRSGLPSSEELVEMIGDNSEHCLFFFDDMIHDIVNNASIERLVRGYAHHYKVTTCIMSQNLYYQGKHSKTLTLNHGLIHHKYMASEDKLWVLGGVQRHFG